MKYNAFLSYSHAQDTDLGTSLEKALEKFAKPTFKRRALEIFRDANDLSLSADLGDKIREGLEESEYFVCMASQLYANSKWCQREVEYWLEHKSIEKFIIVLTDGDILYDEGTNDFDWKVTTALPKNLSGVFKGEPFYVDFRDLGLQEELNLDHPEFRKRLVLLAATIHGKSVGDMEGEAAKQHKRTMRIRNAAISVLSVLLVIAIGASIFAVNKKNEALLSTYIANSQGQFDEDPTKSLRLAEQAYIFAKKKNFPTTEAAEQLIKVFYSGYGFYQVPSLSLPDVSEDEINSYTDKGNPIYKDILRISDSIATTIPRDEYLGNKSDLYIEEATNTAIYVVSSVALNFSKIYFITKDYDGYTIDTTNIVLSGFNGYTGYIEDIDISEDGKYTLLGSANGKTALIENEAYRYKADRNIFKDRSILKSSDGFPVELVSFINGGEYIGVVSFDSEYVNGIRQDKEKTVYYYKTPPFPYIEMVNMDNTYGNLSLDEHYYMVPATADADPDFWFHYAQVIKTTEEKIVTEFPDAKGVGLTATASLDNTFLVSYQGVFNAHNDLLITLNIDTIDNPGVALSFSKDSKFLKVSYLNGLQRIFALDPEFIIKRINDTSTMGNIARLSEADNERFLISD
ncbi:TIR domain-containing protein [uncultured Winogradskyella sp.]|uniref:toll/interleukin-1 receptor domain-containing protein n=1 Tax=uncultured Winogradskyella sp. TaxID=395353 RepID=UPI0030DBBE59|tara:strand:- start:27523 stop:29409 length:1887 start_codon:yes stop_codon:yes gene_type:complete